MLAKLRWVRGTVTHAIFSPFHFWFSSLANSFFAGGEYLHALMISYHYLIFQVIQDLSRQRYIFFPVLLQERCLFTVIIPLLNVELLSGCSDSHF
jgi:hypothetical protein